MASIPDSLRFASSGFPCVFSWELGTLAEHRVFNVPQTVPQDFLCKRAQRSDGWEKLHFSTFLKTLLQEESFLLYSGCQALCRGPIKAPHHLCRNTS